MTKTPWALGALFVGLLAGPAAADPADGQLMLYTGSCSTETAVSYGADVRYSCSCPAGTNMMMLSDVYVYGVEGAADGVQACHVFGQGSESVYGLARADAIAGSTTKAWCKFQCFRTMNMNLFTPPIFTP